MNEGREQKGRKRKEIRNEGRKNIKEEGKNETLRKQLEKISDISSFT